MEDAKCCVANFGQGDGRSLWGVGTQKTTTTMHKRSCHTMVCGVRVLFIYWSIHRVVRYCLV